MFTTIGLQDHKARVFKDVKGFIVSGMQQETYIETIKVAMLGAGKFSQKLGTSLSIHNKSAANQEEKGKLLAINLNKKM